MKQTAAALSPIKVSESDVHGHGVFATERIEAGTAIGHYAGRRYSPKEAQMRDWVQQTTHVFGLSDGSFIDGAEGGNATRFINHSCAPNCVAYEVEGEEGLTVQIEASRRIRAGAELFLDYCLDIGDNDPADYACRCGRRTCRGTFAAPVLV